MRRLIEPTGSLVLILSLAACSVGPTRRAPAPPVPVQAPVPAQDYMRALDLMQRHQDEDAVALLSPLAESQRPGPLINLAILHARQGRPGQAIDLLRQALRIAPANAAAAQWLASLLRDQGQARQAERVLRDSLRRVPDAAASHRNLAILYEQDLGQPRQALVHYRRYQALDPGAGLIVEAWIRALESRLPAPQLAEVSP